MAIGREPASTLVARGMKNIADAVPNVTWIASQRPDFDGFEITAVFSIKVTHQLTDVDLRFLENHPAEVFNAALVETMKKLRAAHAERGTP